MSCLWRYSYRNRTRIVVQVTAALCLLAFALPLSRAPAPVGAAPDANTWSRVNIPAQGDAGGWVLAPGSDIEHLAMAGDGALYAAVKGLVYTLFRSTDGGYRWSHPGNVKDSIAAIATVPGDPNYVYYATKSDVYRSADAGRTFIRLPRPGGAGAGNVEITSLSAVRFKANIIAVATRDTDAGQFGGVYIMNEEEAVPRWSDSGLAAYDIYALAFSPGYTADRGLVAVANNEADTSVHFKMGDRGWNLDTGIASLNRDNSFPPLSLPVLRSASLALPPGFQLYPSPESILFVGVDTGAGQGDVYRVTGTDPARASVAKDLNVGSGNGLSNVDISGLALSGKAVSARLFAGVASSAGTYSSLDGGNIWTRSRKPPTGASLTRVLLAPDETLYTATSGAESAISVSRDAGVTWHQISLVDTSLTTILDLAPSPAFEQDAALFMLTFGGKHSLWRTDGGGESWERIFSSALPGVDSLTLIAVPPEYSAQRQVVYVAGISGGSWFVWKSTDGGRTFNASRSVDPATGTGIRVDVLRAADSQTLLVGSADAANGIFYVSTSGGFIFSPGQTAGGQQLSSIALSPEVSKDGTMLIGNRAGWAYLSTDNGTTFAPLPPDAGSAPLSGVVTLAFDRDFAANRTVYASSDTVDRGIYRFIIGSSPSWERIDTSLPAGALVNQVLVTARGVLYAVNRKAGQGIERSLNASSRTGPVFETLTQGLAGNSTLIGVWASGNRLWSVDTTNVWLVTLRDDVISPPALSTPADGTSGAGTINNHIVRDVRLEWLPVSGATGYQWQVDTDSNFVKVSAGLDDTTRNTSVRLPGLEPVTTYFWRVRVSAPALGEWSARRSFTTALDMEALPLKLESPAPGQSGVPVRPVFQWAPLVGASAYELMIGRDAAFANPVVARLEKNALLTTSWVCDIPLERGITYFWRVRALSANTRSPWSGISSFITEAAPAAAASPISAPPAPAPAVPASLPPHPTRSTADGVVPPFSPRPSTIDPRVSQPAPPETVPVPYPSAPSWVTWLIAGQVLTMLGLTAAVMVLALRRRS